MSLLIFLADSSRKREFYNVDPRGSWAPVDGDGAKNKLLQFQFELKIPSLKSGA